MHPVGYLYEDYHDARSLEHKIHNINWKYIQLQFLDFSLSLKFVIFLMAIRLKLKHVAECVL
jgi:hypothetical protein